MIKELLTELRGKKEMYKQWKQGAGDPRGIQSCCLTMQIHEVRKDKADLELNLAGTVRGNKKVLFKCIGRKRKPREKVDLLLSRVGDLVKNYREG